MRKAIVLQHIACEPPGIYADVLARRGVDLDVVELDEGERLPDWEGAELVVAMGGPMSVNDEQEHGFLVDEKRWIAEVVRAGVPFFGACLGAQLLASSLGAPVQAGPAPEVGVLPVELTEAGRADGVFGVLEDEFPTLQWHGDTFELPEGGVHLGRSRQYEHQALRVGDVAYGVQFHLEVTPAMLSEWAKVPAYVAALGATLGPGGFAELAGQFEAARDEMEGAARSLFARFLDVALGEAP